MLVIFGMIQTLELHDDSPSSPLVTKNAFNAGGWIWRAGFWVTHCIAHMSGSKTRDGRLEWKAKGT
jgi:hypothetical protein